MSYWTLLVTIGFNDCPAVTDQLSFACELCKKGIKNVRSNQWFMD